MTKSTPGPTTAILLAAGQSTRMGVSGALPRKPFLVLEGMTVLEHACDAFQRAPSVSEIVIVAHADDIAQVETMILACPAMKKVRKVVAGGELRTDSVRAGVAAAQSECQIVAIHDVARPLVEPALIEKAIAVAAKHGAAIAAVPATDTIKVSSNGTFTESTLDRGVLWCAQTPQVFELKRMQKLLEQAAADSFRATDDAALHEKYAGPVPIVIGHAHNLKLTTTDDLLFATAILRARAAKGARRK